MTSDWEMVIGLEVHGELNTATKLFCGCRNEFGSEPNTNVCPVCLGLPGSLPVLNKKVVEYAMRLGEALHCEIRASIFHRKNYFYPDMPKDYQISQYDEPINVSGYLELSDGGTDGDGVGAPSSGGAGVQGTRRGHSKVGIERAHIEEDTGKSTHVGGGGRIHEAGHSLVDYNRAGVPLVEIVSAPDLRTAEGARAYVSELRSILLAIDVSDARMEEGSMRVDANVSVHRPDEPYGTRCEIKNLNSLRSLGRAIEFEARRQIELIEAGERVIQQTRHWDENEGRTHTLRSKEEAFDYRYFPEPDLVPVVPDDELRAAVKASLPMLPAERRVRLAEAAGVEPPEAAMAVERGLDELALAAIAAGGDPRRLLTHIEHNLAGAGPDAIDAAAFARLVQMEVGGQLTATQAKQVLADMLESGRGPDEIAADRGFEAMGSDVLATAVDEVIAANPDAWAKYVAGEDKVAGMFVGQVMKATKGQADGKAVTALLQERRSRGV